MGHINLFSKRLRLISYADAPSEFLTRAGEQPPLAEPSLGPRACFPPADPANGYMDFSAGEGTRNLGRTGFVFISKENQFGWLCLETKEGGEQGRRGGSISVEPGLDQMPHVCTHTRGLDMHKRICTPTDTYMHTHRHTYM